MDRTALSWFLLALGAGFMALGAFFVAGKGAALIVLGLAIFGAELLL